jgi:hypothetical protein
MHKILRYKIRRLTVGQHSRLRFAVVAFLLLLVFSCVVAVGVWGYTAARLALARSRGVYATAEEGMRSLLDRGYVDITSTDIRYAGPNSFNGSQPHVWYVVAEVRASRRRDGSRLGVGGCDAPGSFFLETKQGWVHVSEGAFPRFIGFWMKALGLAGPGQATPSTDWDPSAPRRFCRSD